MENEMEREREMERWWVLMFNYGKAKVRRESGGGTVARDKSEKRFCCVWTNLTKITKARKSMCGI